MSRLTEKSIKAIGNRINLLAGRGTLQFVQDGGNRQLVQFTALKGETKDEVERVQNYGLTSNPPAGSRVIFISIGGNRDHPVAIAVDNSAHRVKGLEPGEVALYSDEGDRIVLRRGNKIEVETKNLVITASEKVTIDTPTMECTGEIKDRSASDGVSMSQMRQTYNEHTHNETNSVTNQPNQTMAGGA